MGLYFAIILVSLAFFYALVSASLIVGVSRLRRKTARSAEQPSVSILVPARNEERFIGNCLESLVSQEYPPDRYEIVVVNDRSSDNTPTIIGSYQEKFGTIRCVNIESNASGLTGKQNAMNEGLKVCAGEIILNTDADCVAMPSWVRRTVSYFTPRTGLATGFNMAHNANGTRSLFADLQSLDMLFLMDAAAGAIGMNVPVSCVGRNLAYRKAVLGDAGYSEMGYTITEDAALMQSVARNPDWDIAVMYDRDTAVLTSAEASLKQFLSQRIRWILGGTQDSGLWSLIPLYAIFLFHLCLALVVPLMFFSRSIAVGVLLSLLIKMTMDFIRSYRVCKGFKRGDLLWSFIPYEAFMTFYSIITGFGIIFVRKVRWKGEVYTKDARCAINVSE